MRQVSSDHDPDGSDNVQWQRRLQLALRPGLFLLQVLYALVLTMATGDWQNTVANNFKRMHKPGESIIVLNVREASSAQAAALVPGVKALATDSYAAVAAYGVRDNGMTYEQNMAAVAKIIPVARRYNIPLTVDFQAGYIENIALSITELIKLGAVGANTEDLNDRTGTLRSKVESVQRITAAATATAARDAGVPDSVINARTDVIGEGGTVDEAIDRAEAYIAAGATIAIPWLEGC